MSNAWSYSSLFPQASIQEDSIKLVVRLVEDRGYSLRNSDTGKVTGISSDGSEELEFQSPDKAIDFFAANGGGLNLWKEGIEHPPVFFTFQPAARLMMLDTQRNWTQGRGAADVVSFSVDNTEFRADEPDRINLANDVENLLVAVCTELDAFYGFSADENALEMLILYPVIDVYGFATKQARPSALFWLQYFAADYTKNFNVDALVKFGGTLQPASTGVLLKFFDHPWDVDLKMLGKINEIWRELAG